MPTIARMKRFCLLAALVAGLPTAQAQGQAVRVSGLLPFERGVAGPATPVVNAGALEIPLADRSLRISPWPAFLPQEFAPQQVEALRQPGPAGPQDRISMRPAEGGAPWIEFAAGARPSTEVVGGWKLQHTARGWWLAQGTKLHFLGKDREHAKPVLVPAGIARWCVHLLDAAVPQERPGMASEGEAQASWAAVRMTPGRRCAASLTGTQPSWRKVDGVAGPAA